MLKIALLLPLSNAVSRGIVRGVAAYARAQRGWNLSLVHFRGSETAEELQPRVRANRPDGLIIQIIKPELVEALAKHAPLINVATPRNHAVPCVCTDDEAVSRLVIQHFQERRLRSLVFLGMEKMPFSDLRKKGFTGAAQASGLPFEVADILMAKQQTQIPRLIARWARHLPRPIGLMACYDHMANLALATCLRQNLSVPDDFAIVGVDNDDITCDLAAVPLSSVDLGAENIGQKAATTLDLLLHKKTLPSHMILVPPRGLVVRQSSDILAIEDSEVAQAVKFIHDQAHRPLSVDEVVEATTVGRRVLEQRFRKLLDRSIRDEIYRAHVARARDLLIGTDLPLPEVARRSGFRWLEHFCQRFHESVGTTPGQFRKQFW